MANLSERRQRYQQAAIDEIRRRDEARRSVPRAPIDIFGTPASGSVVPSFVNEGLAIPDGSLSGTSVPAYPQPSAMGGLAPEAFVEAGEENEPSLVRLPQGFEIPTEAADVPEVPTAPTGERMVGDLTLAEFLAGETSEMFPNAPQISEGGVLGGAATGAVPTYAQAASPDFSQSMVWNEGQWVPRAELAAQRQQRSGGMSIGDYRNIARSQGYRGSAQITAARQAFEADQRARARESQQAALANQRIAESQSRIEGRETGAAQRERSLDQRDRSLEQRSERTQWQGQQARPSRYDQQVSAIDDAFERGDLDEDQAREARMRVVRGSPPLGFETWADFDSQRAQSQSSGRAQPQQVQGETVTDSAGVRWRYKGTGSRTDKSNYERI